MKRRNSSSTSTNHPSKKSRTSVLDVSSSSGPATHAHENEETVITSIRGADLALGLRRIPAGFYVAVHHSNLEWRTENKPVSVNNDVIEWDNPIPIPSDLSATVSLTVHASFEFQPILGNGEQLRRLTIAVDELLNRSATGLSLTFFSKDGDVVSPCSSLLVTIKRQNRGSNGSPVLMVLDPHCSTAQPRGQLEENTDQGHSALSCYRKQGEERHLQHAIRHFEHALNICPLDHPCRAAVQSNMAMAKLIQCQVHVTDASIDVPLMLYRNALAARPVGHPDRVSTLIQLAAVHSARSKRRRDGIDAAQVPGLLREAMDLSSCESHEHRAAMLMVQLHGEQKTEPVPAPGQSSMEQESTSGSANMDPMNLGVTLLQRFKRFGCLADLQQAVSVLDRSIRTISVWSGRYPAGLAILGVAFLYQFGRLGELGDLKEAVSRQRDAVGLTPDGHPDKPGRLNNLGISFITRFRRLGEMSDLEEAILRQRLGYSFATRFQRLGEMSDLEEAISRQWDAVGLTPDGHSNKPGCLSNLGNSFTTRFLSLRGPADLEQALVLSSSAACASVGPASVRFQASRTWIFCARLLSHHSLLDAYSFAIGLLPQLAWIGHSLARRYRELIRHADVVREVAAAALDSGHSETAVEWLEQGRSIVWGDLFQLRNSFNELSSVHPYHAHRLRELSAALEHAGSTHEKLSSLQLEDREPLQQEADRHRKLAIERDTLLRDIRGFPGFERFLLHKYFSQLRTAAHSGPVVILNAAESRCDALIVLAKADQVIHIPLPNFTLERCKQLRTSLGKFVREARGEPCDDRYGRPISQDPIGCESILSALWKGVVKPVLDALAFSILGDRPPRIFWCPTGPFTFLPIHAAGFYQPQFSQPGHKVFDFVVSSYIPTLSILSSLRKSADASGRDFCLLAVPQPPSDGQFKLRGVLIELEHIRTIIKNSLSTRVTLTESSVGTVEEVLTLMKESDWVHFACHGVQDTTNPTNSGLCLANERRLRVSDVIALLRSRGGLAFLSACETAQGDEDLSDEAIHIAAGMLFAGYGGVIGTMWSISDKLAPDLAKDFYERLVQTGTRPDHRDAARALHGAVARLRDNKERFEHWLPFMHVGL